MGGRARDMKGERERERESIMSVIHVVCNLPAHTHIQHGTQHTHCVRLPHHISLPSLFVPSAFLLPHLLCSRRVVRAAKENPETEPSVIEHAQSPQCVQYLGGERKERGGRDGGETGGRRRHG